MFDNLPVLNLHYINGIPIDKAMSGPNIIPFGQGKTNVFVAETHLAEARCQGAGTAFRVKFYISMNI